MKKVFIELNRISRTIGQTPQKNKLVSHTGPNHFYTIEKKKEKKKKD